LPDGFFFSVTHYMKKQPLLEWNRFVEQKTILVNKNYLKYTTPIF